VTPAINSDEAETVARIEDNQLRRDAFSVFMSGRPPWEHTPPHMQDLWDAFNAGYGFRKAIETKGKA